MIGIFSNLVELEPNHPKQSSDGEFVCHIGSFGEDGHGRTCMTVVLICEIQKQEQDGFDRIVYQMMLCGR